jgi:hypothetical protein
MCLSHLIYTVRPCLIHTCHAAPMPCSDHAVLLKATARKVPWLCFAAVWEFFGNVLKGNDDSIFILPRSLVKLQFHGQISGSAKHHLTLKSYYRGISISFGLLVRPVVQSVVLCSCDPIISCKVLTYLKLELWHVSVTVCYIKHVLYAL